VVVLFGERGFADGKAREVLPLGPEVAQEDLPAALAPALEGGRLELALGG
jgi:hypothetical protein